MIAAKKTGVDNEHVSGKTTVIAIGRIAKPGDEITNEAVRGARFEARLVLKKGSKDEIAEDAGFSAYIARSGIYICGVFDGVGGHENGEAASAESAGSICGELKAALDRPDASWGMMEASVRKAIEEADAKIKRYGDGRATTSSIALIDTKTGRYLAASVSDSCVYKISGSSAELIAGGPGSDFTLKIRRGVLRKGELLFLATDGVTDNLAFDETSDGGADPSADLASLMLKHGGDISRMLSEIHAREGMRKRTDINGVITPKPDDAATIVVYFQK